jgi:alginate O-acetyltransferase complex protein AlgI
MLFNSYEFIFLFLPVAFAGFFAIARISRRAAAAWLALASLFFYGWWDSRYVILLLGSVVFNYLVGGFIARAGSRRASKLILALGVSGNLLVLGLFKYADFFIGTVNHVAHGHFAALGLVLPLGISFFTFTQIAFLVDVHRGIAREYDFVNYALFVTYFPHLIAGPVIHHKQIIPQFYKPEVYVLRAENVAAGLTIFTIGLVKKVLVADNFGLYASPVFAEAATGAHPQALAAWTGVLAYTFQLYFDFSGYSDMAIGISRLFGVQLPLNFDSPYKAPNIIEFWRRWHMTLSQFLRDYLYFALGGNRLGTARRYANLMITMLLGGLWHGANWTFVVWGGLHGLYLVVNHAWKALTAAIGLRPGRTTRVGAAAGTALTFVSVMIAWVFFRSADMSTALLMLDDMFSLHRLAGHDAFRHSLDTYVGQFSSKGLSVRQFWLMALAGFAIVWLAPNTQTYVSREQGRVRWRAGVADAALWGGLLAFCLVRMVSVSEFLYFQF